MVQNSIKSFSLYRQFLVSNKHLDRISTLEDKLGITGKSIHKWVVGKKPLPTKWEEPLKAFLFPMVDVHNNFHKKAYKADKVAVLLESQVLVQFRFLLACTRLFMQFIPKS